MTDRATRAQIAKIWTMAHALGLDSESLHLLVPGGSIRLLSRVEASELIERLSGADAARTQDQSQTPPPPADSNAATREQLNFIHFLFGRVGWIMQPVRMRGFLRKFAGVDYIEEIKDRRRASAIIEALKAMYNRKMQNHRD